MTRAENFLITTIPLVGLYLLILFKVLPAPLMDEETASQVLPVLPFWLLVTFGSYSLSSLGLGLVRFHDCPEAYESLLGEITEAKNELRDQGVSVD